MSLRVSQALGVGVAALALTACPNPNLYQTARTTPEGKLAFTVAPEVIGARVESTTLDENGDSTGTTEETYTLPMIPSFMMRYGVSEDVDLGFHVFNLSSLGADVKVNLLKDDIDIGVVPGVQAYRGSVGEQDYSVTYFHLPALLDLNISSAVTLVLMPGITYGISTLESDGDGFIEDVNGNSGVIARMGLGFDFRITKKFALHPEVTFMRGLGGDEGWSTFMGGLGFNFGALPSFADQSPAQSESAR